jgi:hypothetical protein
LDEVWSRIPRGKLRSDCIHLAERDHGGSFRDEGHIEDDAGLLDPRGTQEAYDSHNTWPPVIMWEHDRKQVGRRKEVLNNNKLEVIVRERGQVAGQNS